MNPYRVLLAVVIGEFLHHSINLLRLSRQPEAEEKSAKCLDEDEVMELVKADEGVENGLIERLQKSTGVMGGSVGLN